MAKTESAPVDRSEDIQITKLAREGMTFRILGKSPLIVNRMSQKAKRTILFPPPKKNRAEKESTLKHKPLEEFRASPYRIRESEGLTLLGFPTMCFKNATASAAVDMPGEARAVIGRRVYAEGELVPLYGTPQLFMAVVRQAGISRSPDIRTRAILPNWAAELRMSWSVPLIRSTQVFNLLSAAGMIQGVGDWRPEKGKGSYGQFDIVDESSGADWEKYLQIVETGQRAAQKDALENPVCYDLESEELLEWYMEELERRGFSTEDDGDEEDIEEVALEEARRGRFKAMPEADSIEELIMDAGRNHY